jgi:hypothetical protein
MLVSSNVISDLGRCIVRDYIANSHVPWGFDIALSRHENDGRSMKVREDVKAQGICIWQAQFNPRALRDRTTFPLPLISICGCLLLEPRPHAQTVYADAKQVCWNKAKL